MPSTAGTTGTAERTNSIQTLLTSRLMKEVARRRIWDQFPEMAPDGDLPTGGNMAAQTIQVRFQPRLALRTGTIDEKADIVPEKVTDQKVTITIRERGHAVQSARFAEIIQKGNLQDELIDVIAENQTASIDRVVGRNYYEGNSIVMRANSVAARSNLDATNDILSNSGVGMSFLAQATAVLRASRAPGERPNAGGLENYMTVIHTNLGQDLPETNGYLAALQNREGRDTLFNGEMGDIRGLRFMESEQGKLYLGAGTVAQAATTLSVAATKGDTTVTVADATGLAVGDVITIGTIENGTSVTAELEDTEAVLITAVNATVLTIVGLGYGSAGIDTPALRYDHAAGTSVVEAPHVAAIPIFGPRTVMKAYAKDTGPMGRATATGPFDTLGRFMNFGWYAVTGYNKTIGTWSVRLEVAVAKSTIAINE